MDRIARYLAVAVKEKSIYSYIPASTKFTDTTPLEVWSGVFIPDA